MRIKTYLGPESTHNQVKIGRCTNETLTPTDTEPICIDNVNEAEVAGDILAAILALNATCRDPGKVTCDQAQCPSTGSLQRITGNGQHDGGMGAAQQEEDKREERGWSTLDWTEQGRFKQSMTWWEGVGAGILVPVPTHIDQPTGRIDESLNLEEPGQGGQPT